MDSGWEWEYGEDAAVWFLLEKKELSSTFVQEGPPLTQRPYVAAFKRKHKKTFEQDGRVCANVERDCTTIKKCLQNLLKDLYVKERAKKSKVVSL